MLRSRRRILPRGLAPSLNLFALVAAFVGLVFPMTQMSPERFAVHTSSLTATVGASLSAVVPANPYNTLAEQLAQKEAALNERESALNTRDAASEFTTGEMLGFFSFALSVVLCMLVGLNFYLDSRRGRKPGMLTNKFSVDLR